MRDLLRKQWFELRERMMGQVDSHSSISLRLPGEQGMWLGKLDDLAPQAVALSDSIYRLNGDYFSEGDIVRPQKPFSVFCVSSSGETIAPRTVVGTLHVNCTKQEHSG